MSCQDVVDQLKRCVRHVERSRLTTATHRIFSSGYHCLDQALPIGGLVFGELVEWLGKEGAGAGTCGLQAAWQATKGGGMMVVLDRLAGSSTAGANQFYPPAAAALGIDLDQVVMIQTTAWADQLWSLDQALRCRAVAAVWAPVEQISPHDFRRLQLAAEQGQTAGMLIRSPRWLHSPSWSHLQLLVQMCPAMTTAASLAINPSTTSHWQIEIIRSRQGPVHSQTVKLPSLFATNGEVA